MLYTGHGTYLPTYAADGDEFHSLTSGRRYLRVNGAWVEVFPATDPDDAAPVISDPTPPLEEPQDEPPAPAPEKPKKTTRKKKERK